MKTNDTFTLEVTGIDKVCAAGVAAVLDLKAHVPAEGGGMKTGKSEEV